jgi:hypothetical protein
MSFGDEPNRSRFSQRRLVARLRTLREMGSARLMSLQPTSDFEIEPVAGA